MSEAQLRDRIEYLEAENAELRRQMRMDPASHFIGVCRSELKLMPSTARLLWVLWDCKEHTNENLFHALFGDRLDQPDPQIIKVQLSKLRASLVSIDARIETLFGTGYVLRAAHRDRIAAVLGIDPEAKP